MSNTSDAPMADPDFSVFGSVEVKRVSRVQAHVGRAMHRNWTSIPHVTHHDDVDVSEFEVRRKQWNAAHPQAKRTLLPALVKASVTVLQRYSVFNSSLSADGSKLYSKQYFHIGIAVDVPSGLLVPVIRDCDRKTTAELADEIARISEKARSKGLTPDEMAGGCFTLTSLGHIGATAFTPIINAPEVAILGVCRTQERFVPDIDGKPILRSFLPLSLSYDHRIINGADAARFVRAIGDALKDCDFA